MFRYIGRLCPSAYLEGCSNFEMGLVDQWVEFAMNELSYLQVQWMVMYLPTAI